MIVRNSVAMAPTGAVSFRAKGELNDAFVGSSEILVREGDQTNFAELGPMRVSYADPNDVFISASGALDLHLKSTDTAAAEKGELLDGPGLNTDIDGELRVAPWDLGADER